MNDPRKPRKRMALWILLAVLGPAGFVLGWWVSGADRHEHAAPAVSVSEQPPAGTAVLQMYTCSMHPQVRSPDPRDRCPICGMDLIPVPADDAAEEDRGDLPRLRASPRAAALMQVAVLPVHARRVSVPVRVYGRIGYDETRLSTVSAWVPGRLERLFVDSTGTAVREGQPMVEIYSPALVTAQEEHLQAMQVVRDLEKSGVARVRDAAGMTVGASRDRLRLLGLDGEQIRRLERRGRVEERVMIPAPLSGVVIERLATAGDYVETGRPIYRLADLAHLWVVLEAYESDIPWLELGQRAAFTTRSRPGERFEGKVVFIDPVLNERTRTVGVRVELPNPDGRLKPGMFVQGTIEAVAGRAPAPAQPRDPHAGHGHPSHPPPDVIPPDPADGLPLVIPASAPLVTGERAVVYVQLPDEEQPTYEPRDILLGPRAGDWYLVREGLAPGELVVVHGAFKIDAELQIRGRPSMMQPEGGPPPVHDHGDPGVPSPDPRPEPVTAPEPFREQIGRVVTASFELVSALAADDPEAAREAALRVHEALRRVEPARLAEDAHRRQWNRLAGTLHEHLMPLASSADLEDQRRRFKGFSHALIEAVAAFGVAEAGAVYRAMCPMVNGDRAYWLQPQRAITNPYHGSRMFSCGEIRETISEPEPDEPRGGHP